MLALARGSETPKLTIHMHLFSCETHAPPLEIYFHAHALHQWTSVDMTRPIQICERLFVKSKLAGFASWMKMGKGLNIHCDDQCQLMLGFNDFFCHGGAEARQTNQRHIANIRHPGRFASSRWRFPPMAKCFANVRLDP